MKKILIICLSMLAFMSCQDELKEEFKNPNIHTPEAGQVVSGLFTSALTEWKFYVKDYGEYWWQFSGNGIPSYAQIAHRYITPRYSWYVDYDDVQNGLGFDQSGFTWFQDYYTRMRHWADIRDILQSPTITEEEYNDGLIYFMLTSILKDWGALRNVDLYNSIPYLDAFQGTQGILTVPYDDPKEIYVTVLNDLKRIAEELPGVYNNMSSNAKSLLERQDVALSGDINKWVQYANALRLRYAVKLAGVDQQTASQHISEAMANLPQEDLLFETNIVDAASELPGGVTWHRGLYERPYVTFIPNVIMNRMNFHELVYEEEIDDPRLPVLALPTKHNDYRGVSMNADEQEMAYNNGETYYPWADNLEASSTDNAKSMYSHVTFTHNNMPHDMFTLAEIDLLLAEVAAKNLASTGKSAGEHIEDAVIHSTDFWYYINSLSTYREDFSEPWLSLIHPTKPSATIISSYAAKVRSAFDIAGIENQMEIIMQQKYIHLNVLRPIQLWSELRRTRHPKLEKMTMNGKVMAPTPERLKYPSSEVSTNTENYLKVADQDNWTTPIFWVTDHSTYYRDDYVTFKTSELPDFN